MNDESYKTPDRRNKRQIAGHFPPEIQKELKQIALNENSSVQALLKEAINDLLEKKNSQLRIED